MVTGAPVDGLNSVRSAVEGLLLEAGLLGADWDIQRLKRLDHRTVSLALGPTAGRHVLLNWTEHAGDQLDTFLRGDLHAVAYSNGPGAWDLDSDETPPTVKERAVRTCTILAETVDTVGIRAQWDDTDSGDRRIISLEASDVEAWLSPKLKVDQEIVDGWALDQIYPRGTDELVLAFAHSDVEVNARLRIRVRDDDRPAVFRSRCLDVIYRGNADEELQAGRKEVELRIAAELVLLLSSLETPGVEFQGRPGQDQRTVPTAGPAQMRALNLAIPAPCGVQCSFCSIREELEEVHDSSSLFVQSLREDIRRAGADGVELLRINGIEPLNAPYLFDLLRLAKEGGFREFSLHSTCLPFAKGDFASRFVAAMPERYRIYVPIYGATAEIHDGVVGVPGTFEKLMAAIANLRAAMDKGGTVIFTTVVTRENVNYLTAIRDLVRPLCDWWEVHLAFPNTSSATDKYRDIAISMSEALKAVYPKGWWPVADLPWGEILPCIAYTHQKQTGHELLSLERFNRRVREPAGTFYSTAGFEHSLGGANNDAFTAATVPCPHREICSLKNACPAKVYALYEAKYGLDELKPLSDSTLEALPDGPALLREIEKLEG